MHWASGWVAAAVLLSTSAWAGPGSEYGVRSLEGLGSVRVVVVAAGAVDGVDAEVILLQRLRGAGIDVAPTAPAMLTADLRTEDHAASAELVLSQPVCLERDPAVSDEMATWAQGEAVRGMGEQADGQLAVSALGSLADAFVADWRRANGPR